MPLLPTWMASLRSIPPVLLLLASSAVGQQPAEDRPAATDPKEMLRRCLDAHRGGHTDPPRNLLFIGDVRQKSAPGDIHEADIWQWYARHAEGDGAVREEMVTRMRAKGTDRDAIRGFDGKRHFVVVSGARINIDFQSSHQVDLQNIKRDLGLTRFLADHFLAGGVLAADARFTDLGRQGAGSSAVHRIARTTPDGVTTVYQVTAAPGRKPYLHAIEFPAAEGQPKRLHRFAHVRAFGKVHLPQEIRITDEGDERSEVSIWITEFRIDEAKPPAWADIAGYPRRR